MIICLSLRGSLCFLCGSPCNNFVSQRDTEKTQRDTETIIQVKVHYNGY